MKVPNTKFVVEVLTPGLSALIQKKMHTLGYGWIGKPGTVEYTDKKYLYFSGNRITHCDDGEYMKRKVKAGDVVKLTIEEIFSLVSPKTLAVGILKDYPIEIQEDGVKAGGEFISRKDFEGLARTAQEFWQKVDQ